MIPIFFNILFFVIPLIFFKNTSELFEFNKIVTLYAFTALIVSAWAIQSIRIKKFIFRKTLLDIPLIIYLSIYLVSSLLSIDPRTSVFGYYSRFNGGLISQICYVLLYWAFVSNMTDKNAKQSLVFSLWSLAIASILAVGERFGAFATCGLMGFGYKESCWVQDVQNRVFSTLGQPNWLAAILTALMPIAWSQMLNDKKANAKYSFLLRSSKLCLSFVFFITLLFTKSRSGLLALYFEVFIFLIFMFWQSKHRYVKITGLIVIYIILFFSFNPSKVYKSVSVSSGPSLETGGTESSTIRKHVWMGAFEVFKHYPILGTGPETFAFSFPMYKPVGHNLTSEWDFIYNKAHNEFLNYLANTGLLGFMSYMSLIIYSIIIFFKSKRFDLLSGYVAILITNFFGFSVVPVSLLFFLFPAVALASSAEGTAFSYDTKKTNFSQKILIILVLITTLYTLYAIRLYWLSDIYYNSSQFEKAISISPNEPNYISKSSLSDNSVETALKALEMNPYNQNSRRILVSNLVKEDSLKLAEAVIKDGIELFPNDPKLFYQLGIVQLKTDEVTKAINSLSKSILLKPNYKEARFALGATYVNIKEFSKAKTELEYILQNIDPNDELTKKYLNETI